MFSSLRLFVSPPLLSILFSLSVSFPFLPSCPSSSSVTSSLFSPSPPPSSSSVYSLFLVFSLLFLPSSISCPSSWAVTSSLFSPSPPPSSSFVCSLFLVFSFPFFFPPLSPVLLPCLSRLLFSLPLHLPSPSPPPLLFLSPHPYILSAVNPSFFLIELFDCFLFWCLMHFSAHSLSFVTVLPPVVPHLLVHISGERVRMPSRRTETALESP